MGTVGLNFGSPTSGAGFDVSSTVASIVGNLKNVETPWKTQLTALQSQDTAISSLGTLFSNLSNDISSLTDFQGIMAQKEGSSSDTNVLSLTAANNTAVAGTHTVTVTNLAQTSSGYLAAIANSSDTLSGSITLQVGAGKTTTIDIANLSNKTLSGLAAAINSSGAGVSAGVLTDSSGSRLSLVSGTSGAHGNIAVTANSIADINPKTLSYTDGGYNPLNLNTGLVGSVGSGSDKLTGSIAIGLGAGAQTTITLAPEGETLASLASAINTTYASLGVTASVVTSNGQSSMSLVSQTAGAAGALNVTSSITDSAPVMGYNSTVSGKDAQLTVDGINLTSASNTVANLIPGVTFQLLAPSAKESDGSLEQIQVVIANDNAGVYGAVATMVSDYNAAMSAMSAQMGYDSSGNAEPLFGSPTLSLLQQQLLGSLNLQNPNGTMDAISATDGTTLSGSISIAVGNGATDTFIIGAGSSSAVAGTFYTNNTDAGGVDNGNTLAGLAATINAASAGLTAGVVTAHGQSTLTLASLTAGSRGALSVASAVAASSPLALGYSDAGYTSSTADSGKIGTVANSADLLTGSFTIQVGSGTPEQFNMSSLSNQTVSGLASAINDANIGVTATLDSTGTFITLASGTVGSAGALKVSSSLLDPTSPTSKTLNYNNSSDIANLSSLGISVANDGTLTLGASFFDSLLNSDYSSVVGFFQNANSWGQTFSAMLTNAGTKSSTGILALAGKSNSAIESTLNANISKEESLISIQQKSLTAELNSANEIMQMLPSQLEGVNQLYSAITGYNQNR